jgi:hypothetical protein
MSDQPENKHLKRDGETMILLGLFLGILGVPVLIGTLWSNSAVAAIVNVVSSLALFMIAGAFYWRGRKLLRSAE